MCKVRIDNVTEENLKSFLDDTFDNVTIRRMPYADIPGTNPAWEIVYEFPDGIQGTNNIVKDSLTYKDKGITILTAENPIADVVMSLVHRHGENTAIISAIVMNGRVYQAERYLKKYSHWATLLTAMERYGYFN